MGGWIVANKIRPANIPVSKLVSKLSRYKSSEVIYYGDNNYITFKTYKREVIPTSSQDKYTVVSPGMEYRPDLLSQRAYGVPDFWWRILEANNLKDVFEFKSGLNIRIPGNVFG